MCALTSWCYLQQNDVVYLPVDEYALYLIWRGGEQDIYDPRRVLRAQYSACFLRLYNTTLLRRT